MSTTEATPVEERPITARGRRRADFFALDEQGRCQPVPLPLSNIYRSAALPGFCLKTDRLWQDGPDPLAARGVIAGPERVLAAPSGEGA